MKYTDARPLIESGDVIALGHTSWSTLSDLELQAVRFFTRSEFAHVGVAWVVGGRVMIIEAVVPRVRIFPLSSRLPFYWIPMRSPLTEESVEYALSLVGNKYSKLEAIRGFFGINRNDSSWQCAELVRSILDLPGKATPTAVVRSCMDLGNPLITIRI